MRVIFAKHIFSLLFIFLLFFSLGRAQSNLVMYHTDELFNSSNYNPAFISSDEKFTFSVFPLAGMNANFNDTEALKSISDLLFFDQISNTMIDIFRNMVNKDLYYQHGEASLLNFGYHTDFGSFNFVIKDHVRLMVDFDGELSKFLMNESNMFVPLGQSQEFPAEGIHFREYSLGYANEIVENRLSVGVRAKLLFGKSYLSSNVSALTQFTNNTVQVVSNGALNISVPATTERDVNGNFVRLNPLADQGIGEYLFNGGNMGTAFDLGIKYAINPDMEFSASLVDVGKISWKNNLHDLVFVDGQFPLDPGDINSSALANGGNVIEKNGEVSLVNDISKLFGVPDVQENSYSRSIPASFYAGVKYTVDSRLQVGVVDRYIKSNKLSFNSLSLTANYKLTDKLTAISGYSLFGSSLVNIPFGLFYEWDSGQAYLSSDNLISMVMPSVSDFYGFSFGMCFYILRPKMNYDHIYYLPFYKRKKKRNTDGKGLIIKAK